jgi:tetraacyldisaccharide 4'-kinase
MKTYPWLLPLSWLYGLGVRLRNAMYDCGLMESRAYGVPLICVGNLTVGGTGKTPHTEYLVRLLHDVWRVGIVSRGYKRKTRGLVVATEFSTSAEIGDEPWQMKQKFKDVAMAVCGNRRMAIEKLMSAPAGQQPQVVLLDDAFQHRSVKAGFNILLTDYNRLISDDLLLPAGRLREPFSGRRRADVVIVTKSPHDIDGAAQQRIKEKLRLLSDQRLFFTCQKYMPLKRVSGEEAIPFESLGNYPSVLIICGIATPQLLARDVEARGVSVKTMAFPDHHAFTHEDIIRMNQSFAPIAASGGIALTTEKDAARLHMCEGLSQELKDKLYVLPLEIAFLNSQSSIFNELVSDYVRENQANS